MMRSIVILNGLTGQYSAQKSPLSQAGFLIFMNPFLKHLLNQINNAAGITPLVVIP